MSPDDIDNVDYCRSSSSSCSPREYGPSSELSNNNNSNGNIDGDNSNCLYDDDDVCDDTCDKEDESSGSSNSTEFGDVGDDKVLRGFAERRFYLIHAIAIVWTQSLLSFHLLLLDYGYDANNPASRKGDNKKFEPMLKGCVERAFAYFNVNVISQVEAMFEKERESSDDEHDSVLMSHSSSINGIAIDRKNTEKKVRSLDEIINRVFDRSIRDVLKSLGKILKFSTYKSDSFLQQQQQQSQLLQSPKLQRLQPLTTSTNININK